MARRRHLSRIVVMQALFERDARPGIDPLAALSRDRAELGEIDQDFALALLCGVLEREDDLRAAIQAHAPGWTLQRMDPISRAVLFVGTFEILYGKDAPPAVVMNEAIEIAKEFGTGESGKFVNGVLNAIAQGKAAKE
jgi:N utilization substance protein B